MRHSSGGENSSTLPLSTRIASACSRMGHVVKGQTGALFLLDVIVLEALIGDLLDMKNSIVVEEDGIKLSR